MGLKEALDEIAGEMEEHSGRDTNPLGERTLARMWAKQLRTAVKAADDPPSRLPRDAPGVAAGGLQHNPDPSSRAMFQRAFEAAERLAAGPTAGQRGGDRMWECEGGPFDGVQAPAASQLPQGAFTLVGDDCVYQREGGSLVYSEAQSEQRRKSLKGVADGSSA